MNWQEFSNQLDRLEKQFGKYGEERTKILWSRIEDLSHSWFRRQVDMVLGSCRQSPMPDDFGEEIAKENEKINKTEKEQQKPTSLEDPWGKFLPEEKKEIGRKIIHRMLQRNTTQEEDADFKKYIRTLESAANMNPQEMAEYREWERTFRKPLVVYR